MDIGSQIEIVLQTFLKKKPKSSDLRTNRIFFEVFVNLLAAKERIKANGWNSRENFVDDECDGVNVELGSDGDVLRENGLRCFVQKASRTLPNRCILHFPSVRTQLSDTRNAEINNF